MIRSLFTAIGGLKNHQVMMDVTANNIANVNTVGYKTERASFASMLSQNVRGASAPQAGGARRPQPDPGRPRRRAAGRAEPAHAGLAADDRSVERPGDPGRRLLHRVADPPDRRCPDRHRVHACRQLHASTSNGDLVTAGRPVRARLEPRLGRPAADLQRRPRPDQHPGRRTSRSRSARTASSPTRTPPGQQTAGQLAVAKFPNPGGLQRLSDNLYGVSPNSGTFDPTNQNNGATPTAGTATWGAAATNGRGGITSGTLEMSNVDLAQEFTSMITAQRGFQANARTITTSDTMLDELVNLKR